ncbi:MAG: stage II sporulation protein M [Marinilabiliaceae bacterium]|nr:stage II sporulation protein M [Marinilabiliaceae bacterium]
MKEVTFINRNQKRWQSFEKTIHQDCDPDKLADQYIQVIDDLSYARTFYAKSRITSYLNRLALKIHQEIYKNKKEKSSRLKQFFKLEVPLILKETQPQLILSFAVFILSVFLGVISALTDDSFIRLILPDSYINKTLNNIQQGNPMGIYGETSQMPMFIAIASNNIFVSFYAFLMGILTHLGTGYVLVQNGIMVGSFVTFFYQKNLLGTSLYTIMIHGTLELSAITIAGAAGFLLGNSFLFPGSYSRMESFKKGAKDATKIMLALVPVFLIAGFFESFVTRYYQDLPVIVFLIIIALSLTFIIWYFFIYPHKISKKLIYTLHETNHNNNQIEEINTLHIQKNQHLTSSK